MDREKEKACFVPLDGDEKNLRKKTENSINTTRSKLNFGGKRFGFFEEGKKKRIY